MEWDASLCAPARRNQTPVSRWLVEDSILGINQNRGKCAGFSRIRSNAINPHQSRSVFQAKITPSIDNSLDSGDPITLTRLKAKTVNQIFCGNSTSCHLGPVTGHAALGQVDVISTEAMETGDAEDVPLEHSEGLKRQRLHSLSSTVSSNHVDSSEDNSTLEAGLANHALRHK
ncbi:hypothetical protein V6N13_125207 [Hibiscus sabdariffa]